MSKIVKRSESYISFLTSDKDKLENKTPLYDINDVSELIEPLIDDIIDRDPWIMLKIFRKIFSEGNMEKYRSKDIHTNSFRLLVSIDLDEDFVNKTMEGNKNLQSLLNEFYNVIAKVKSQDDYTKKLFYNVIKQTYTITKKKTKSL